jgi:hypothetical protein
MEMVVWGYGLIEVPRVSKTGQVYFSDVFNGAFTAGRLITPLKRSFPSGAGLEGWPSIKMGESW